MKNSYLLFLMLLGGLFSFGQNIPIDFEPTGNGAAWNWAVFENNTNPALEIIANPDTSGINCSPTVAKFTALQAGNPWAGCESLHGAGIGSWTIDSSNYIINIMVWKPVISDVGIKLVRFDNWSLGEIKIPNTKINEWELIQFDFSAHMGNPYDQIVIFPDFIARPGDNICYFDNIYGDTAVTGCGPATGIEELQKLEMGLYPNPTNDQLTLSLPTYVDGTVSIHNLMGQELINQKLISTQTELRLRGILSNGVYVASVVDAKGNLMGRKKFIFQQ